MYGRKVELENDRSERSKFCFGPFFTPRLSYSKNFRLRFWLAIISLKMVSYVMFSPSAFDEWSDETFRYLLKKLKAKLLKIEIIDKE